MLNSTLQDIFLKLCSCSDRGITLINGSNDDTFVSYKQLNENASYILGSLQHSGLKEGDELVFQLQDSQLFIETFWACILGKIIPVPVNFAVTNDLKNKLFKVFQILNSPYLITSETNYINNLAKDDNLGDVLNNRLVFTDELTKNNIGEIKKAGLNDIAYIQFSSGSTGNPKGVILTHQNLVTNVDSIHNGINSPENGDSFFSWMPLTHDMGLIGFHLTPIAAGWNHYIMPTELFMRNPSLWFRKISDYKITFSASPNFGYQYLLKHFSPEKNGNIDLSSLRIIVNGAEPISLDICKNFNQYFKQYGLNENAIFPVYGLAEASLAVSFSQPETKIQSIEVNRQKLSIGDKVELLQEHKNSIQFVSVGKQIKNTYLKIVDENYNELPVNSVGLIQIKGNNVTGGYYNNNEATKSLISEEDWLNTGDLGFLDDEGKLYVTGRYKDIIFINGMNLYSHDLERIAEKVEGIELGKIIVSGDFNSELSRDELVAFILFRGKPENFIQIKNSCQKVIGEEVGIKIDQFIPVKNIPKTTSGKVQRYKLLNDYLNGKYNDIILKIKSLEVKPCIFPKNKLQENILKIWQEILGIKDISIDDDFFVLGGNSLQAGQMVMNLEEELNLDISFENIYACRTIEKLSELPQKTKISEEEITPKERPLEFGLSHAQNRIFYYYQLNRNSLAYNVPLSLMVEGHLKEEKLKKAFTELIQRHDILRTTFHLNGAEAYQKVHEEPVVLMDRITLDEKSNLQEQILQHISSFELEKLPLIRLKYDLLESGKTVLILDAHHIIADGTSVITIIRELLKLYNGEAIQKAGIQYADYVLWEEKYLQSGKIESAKEFWKNQFQGNIPTLNLPVDDIQIDGDTEGIGARFFEHLGKDLKNSLEIFSKNTGISKPVILSACYSLLLQKITGQEDMIIGMAESGRNHVKFLDMVGMFVNNLPIRFFPNGDISLKQYLQNVNELFMKALTHKSLPYNELLNTLDIQNTRGKNPLFDTMFTYQNMDMSILSKSMGVHYYPVDYRFSKFELSMEVIEDEDLSYALEYSTSLFKEESIKRFSEYFEKIVSWAIQSSHSLIKDIHILSNTENIQLLTKFNETDFEYPEILIHDLFESHALKNPDSIALIQDKEKITYKTLNLKAEKLAAILIERGLKPGDFVVILANRSIEYIISVLAVLKAGGAFVPLDENYPLSRKKYILEDSNASFVLTTSSIKELNTGILTDFNDDNVLCVDYLDQYNSPLKQDKISVNPENLAYMIYTSGTSGKPKGVMIEHRNLSHYILWGQKMYVKEAEVNFPLLTSIAFDLTVTSVFLPLSTGNSLIIYSEDDFNLVIEKVLEDDLVGVIKLTPSHLKIIKEIYKLKHLENKNLKRFIIGGEDLSFELAESISSLFLNKVDIFNEYGPTEATVGCMIYKFDAQKKYGKSVSIGYPIDNSKIYLLDKYLKPVAKGVQGEIFIGGLGIGRGYHNKKELTEEKFVFIPEIYNGKLYRTGDLARFLDDNNIEFNGRIDSQVKINGFRVELDEIELCIQEYEGIKNVVVSQVNRNNVINLCAYYVADKEIKESDLRAFLQNQLPFYMVPSLFFNIEKIPLTQNGKVDKDALLDINIEGKNRELRFAENEIQEILIQAFKDVLFVNELGIDDNFYELGGDSIKAVQITSKLYEKNILLKVKDILTHQTISQISIYAKKSDKEYSQGIISGEKSLNPIEEWFFRNEFQNQNYFNQSVLLRFKKAIDKNILKQVFKKLIEHHDGLRLNYNPVKACLFYNNDFLSRDFVIEETTLDESNTLELAGAKFKSSFDITNSLLFKALILKEEEKEDSLLITAHHLVMDGVSWRIILEDIYQLYKAFENQKDISLPKKTGSLTDWQNALAEYAKTEDTLKQADYWKEVETTEFKLFNQHKSQYEIEDESTSLQVIIPKDKTRILIKEANKPYNTDIQILLLTALSLTLKEWTSYNHIVFEMEGHGRDLDPVDVSRTVGWFTTMYPVVFNFTGKNTGEQIKHIKEKIRSKIFDPVSYGVNKYLNKNLSQDLKRTEIRFNYLGQFGKDISNDLFTYSYEYTGDEYAGNTGQPTLEIISLIIDEELRISFNFNTSNLQEFDLKYFEDRFENMIDQVILCTQNEEDLQFTPSDFETAELDDDDLSALFE